MSLRDHCTPEQRRAHALLDAARIGLPVSHEEICWALLMLGEPV
jgi:hypothetical protein